jgi:hypothetical protein
LAGNFSLVEITEALRVRDPSDVPDAIGEPERLDVRVVLSLLGTHQVHQQVGPKARMLGDQLGDGAEQRAGVEHRLDVPRTRQVEAVALELPCAARTGGEVRRVVAVGEHHDPLGREEGILREKAGAQRLGGDHDAIGTAHDQPLGGTLACPAQPIAGVGLPSAHAVGPGIAEVGDPGLAHGGGEERAEELRRVGR